VTPITSRILFAISTLVLCGQAASPVFGNENSPKSGRAGIVYPFKIEALCALYSQYETCHPVVSVNSFTANFPTEYISLKAEDIVSIKYLERKGDRDFAVKYIESGKIRTAFVRFKNSNSLFRFSQAIQPLQELVSARTISGQ